MFYDFSLCAIVKQTFQDLIYKTGLFEYQKKWPFSFIVWTHREKNELLALGQHNIRTTKTGNKRCIEITAFTSSFMEVSNGKYLLGNTDHDYLHQVG